MTPTAHAEQPQYALQSDVDHVWTMTAAALVMLMQAGFLLLEAGQVRAKNAVNVAQKNLIDFMLSAVCFGVVGFTLMFGTSVGGWIGWSQELFFFGGAEPWTFTFFVFQLVFCGTAATVVSGAVAERMAMSGYIALTLLIATLIYPIAGHWIWGGLLNDSKEPWLAAMGFMDFAGSTVVHSVGAWAALAAIIVIGPRVGKFDIHGKPIDLHGHSPVLATMGALLLMVGWIGFNGGSTTSGSEVFARIIANTLVSGSVGGVTCFIIGRFHHGYNRPEFIINGLLAGLVGITAGCDVMTPQHAAIVGVASATGAYVFREILERVCKLDDPLGAISVHGVAGVIGTLLIAILAPVESLLAGSRSAQIATQLTGVGAVFVWSFGISYTVLRVLNAVLPSPDGPGRGLRVSEEDELTGLNIAEHHAPLGAYGLTKTLAAMVNDPNMDIEELTIDAGDETAEAAALLNQLLRSMRQQREAELANSTSAEDVEQFNALLLETISAFASGDFNRKISANETPDNLSEITHTLNSMAESVQTALSSVEQALNGLANGDLSTRIQGDYSGVIAGMQTSVNSSLGAIEGIISHIDHVVSAAGKGDFSQQVPIDGQQGYLLALSQGVNRISDIAQTGLNDISCTMSSISEGDLSARLSDQQPGAFARIGVDIADMAQTTSSVIERIASSAKNVQDTANSLGNTSDSLAHASTENRTRIEALNEELHVLREIIANNEKSVQIAVDSSTSARKAADDALAVSRKTVDEMRLTYAAVEEITKSVEAIDWVTRQTRLLSLNASVESTRVPDDVGKGFAVVANEIRELANASSQNAEEVKARLDAVRTSIDSSVTSVAKSDEALALIHQQVDSAEECVLNISESGAATLSAIDSVKKQVDAVSENTQKAASGLQAAAEAATSLELDAAATQSEISHFFPPDERDNKKAA